MKWGWENRWKIVHSAAMQSSSQLLSGNYSGSYVTEGLGWGEGCGRQVVRAAGQLLEEMVRWLELVL